MGSALCFVLIIVGCMLLFWWSRRFFGVSPEQVVGALDGVVERRFTLRTDGYDEVALRRLMAQHDCTAEQVIACGIFGLLRRGRPSPEDQG